MPLNPVLLSEIARVIEDWQLGYYRASELNRKLSRWFTTVEVYALRGVLTRSMSHHHIRLMVRAVADQAAVRAVRTRVPHARSAPGGEDSTRE